MTAEQILGIAQTATDMLSQQAAPAAPVAPTAPTEPEFAVADSDYVTGADIRRVMSTRPVDDTAVRLAADANLSIVRSQNAAVFGKYAAEINSYVERVPSNLRTIDNLQQVVRMVQANHLDEIAEERAQQRLASMAPTLRPTGGGNATAPVSREHTLESEKIPQEWKDRARAAGVTENVVADFARANGMTTADFYKQFDTPMNKIVEDVSVRRRA